MTRQEFLDNQIKYCKDNGLPLFMSSTGFCWRCGQDIVPALIAKGQDGKHELVTGCPLCNRSYCD